MRSDVISIGRYADIKPSRNVGEDERPLPGVYERIVLTVILLESGNLSPILEFPGAIYIQML